MKRLAHGMLGLLASIFLFVTPALSSADPIPITIIHVNDTHSHLDAVGPKDANLDGTLGGLAKAASVIGYLKATEPNALFVHAGDVFQGDVYFYAPIPPAGVPLMSVPELTMLAGLGLDAIAVGNHELFLESAMPGTYRAVLDAASQAIAAAGLAMPAVLSANLDVAAAGLEGVVTPSFVRQIGGVNVGFFGMTVVDALSAGWVFPNYLDIAQAQVSQLREGAPDRPKADVVVCLSHLGLDIDRALAAGVQGLDAIVGGHNHEPSFKAVLVTGPTGKEVPIVRAGDYYKRVGTLRLSVTDGVASFASYELVPVDASTPRLPAIAAVVNGLKRDIDALYGEDFWHHRIGYAIADVAKEVDPASPARDSPVANLVTDAYRARGRTDIAMTVEGFLTEGLSAGPIVGDDAFRIVGDGMDAFGGLGFPLFRIRMTGENLLAALETTLALGGDYLVYGSGLRYVFDSGRPPGQRLVAAYVDGERVRPRHVYSATINYGVLQGLSRFSNVQIVGSEPLGTTDYPAVRDFILHRRLLLYFPHGRVVDLAKKQEDR